jgi:PEGA domain
MRMNQFTTPLALLAAFTMFSAPASAQERGRRERSGQESSGRSAERAQPRSEAPRSPAPQIQGAAPRVESRLQAPRAESQRQIESPRVETRQDGTGRNVVGRAVPRRDVIVPRGTYAPRYAPRYSPRVYAPRYYQRPYVFRPRLSLGFGIFAGYPVPYSYSYPYPIMVYGYRAPRVPVMITPGSAYYGGVALEITPYDADVLVDGTYAGRVEDFDGSQQPLTLTPGTHRVEIQAPGYAPLIVDVMVQPGQVIPYRGDLQPS